MITTFCPREWCPTLKYSDHRFSRDFTAPLMRTMSIHFGSTYRLISDCHWACRATGQATAIGSSGILSLRPLNSFPSDVRFGTSAMWMIKAMDNDIAYSRSPESRHGPNNIDENTGASGRTRSIRASSPCQLRLR